MAEGFSIVLNLSEITMDSIDSREVKGFLNRNGVGFSAKIGFFVETASILSVENSDDIFSDEDGNFIFVIDSAYDDYRHSTGDDPLIEKRIGVLYATDSDGLLARSQLSVIVKPTPI